MKHGGTARGARPGGRKRSRVLLGLLGPAAALLACGPWAGRAGAQEAAPAGRPIAVEARRPAGKAGEEAQLAVSFPGSATADLLAPEGGWQALGSFEFQVLWPEDAPADAQVLVHMTDADGYWFQHLLPDRPEPGRWKRFAVDLRPGAEGWEPSGHRGAWQLRTLMKPRGLSVRLFSDRRYAGLCTFGRARGHARRPDPSPPAIRRVSVSAERVRCFERFEVRFELPDRYPNPFDTSKITVGARIAGPDGVAAFVGGFYSQDYYRLSDAAGERLAPQGAGHWKVRFTPTVPGVYRFALEARDPRGKTSWGPGSFVAEPSDAPGFVRVSARDPRYFERDDGSPFFPVGHNTHTLRDVRYDEQFPWQERPPRGKGGYADILRQMAVHGENTAEVWMAAWSLGLEWSEAWFGYHGVGQYNLFHAWELDEVLATAEQRGIAIHLVIHNHGKFSDWSDSEWAGNPFNTAMGGYLSRPEQYFTDPRALVASRKLLRYIVARWGYSPAILGWELWSELDLTGSRGMNPPNYKRPEVVDWHRLMARFVKEIDPNDHLVGTHVCGDYTHQFEPLLRLPELDYAPIDAYYGSSDPLHIVELLRLTAAYNNPFGKPVIVTEFGGSPRANQGLEHLGLALHAALWGSAAVPVAGTPLFWWWKLIEEENFYPRFAAFARFMEGEDPRDAEAVPRRASVEPAGSGGWQALCTLSPSRGGRGWVYRTGGFADLDPAASPAATGLELVVEGLGEGVYTVEFWDTVHGRPAGTVQAEARDGNLRAPLPPVVRDLAFKVRRPGRARP